MCKQHGGMSPQAKRKAVERLAAERAQADVVRLGGMREVDPHTFLLEEVHRTAAAVEYLSMRCELVSDPLTESDKGYIAYWQQERRHGVVASKAAVDAGVDVRRVELEQARVGMQAAGVRAGMDAVGMGEGERVVFVRAMLAQLRVIGETGGE